jgi:hypothetical protein
MKTFISILLLFAGLSVKAQYAPQAGVAGSTAIPASSSQIVGWANHCQLTRGYLDIAQPSLGFVTSGDSSLAVGAVDNFIVSLGDSGVAVLSFENYIVNGPGPDFAVFENGFANPANPEEAFLELAFVEVSSDGVNYFRFPSASLTQADTQIAAAGIYMNAGKLNNLAGKYISGYGTPFDLQELAGTTGLDLNHIINVRLIDVVGSVGAHANYDNSGHKINDPYPTPFPTGGFDLDAVGVINQTVNSVSTIGNNHVKIFPNPVTDILRIEANGKAVITLTDVTGKTLFTKGHFLSTEINMTSYSAGTYFITISNSKGKWSERIIRL